MGREPDISPQAKQAVDFGLKFGVAGRQLLERAERNPQAFDEAISQLGTATDLLLETARNAEWRDSYNDALGINRRTLTDVRKQLLELRRELDQLDVSRRPIDES
jgi:hypothetical protein